MNKIKKLLNKKVNPATPVELAVMASIGLIIAALIVI